MVECFHEHFLSSECHKDEYDMCSQKQTSYNEMRLDIFLVAHTKLRYRLIIQPTVQPQTPVPPQRSNHSIPQGVVGPRTIHCRSIQGKFSKG